MRDVLVRLDDFVIDRLAQPAVNRFPGVPLREQVRFCTAGLLVATAAKFGWIAHAGKLDAAEVVWHAVLFVTFGFNYAGAWGVTAETAARNPNRIDPLLRAGRLLFLAWSALQSLVLAAAFASLGWDTQGALLWEGALLWAWCAIYTATIYAAACDDPPPPIHKAAAVLASA